MEGFLDEALVPGRSLHWKKLCFPRVLKLLDENASKTIGFLKVFELSIILGKNLANTTGFGTFFLKILKTPRFWKVFWMKPWCLDEASIEKSYVSLKFFKVLDENVSKAIGFWRFFELSIILGKNLANTKGFDTFFLKILKALGFGRFFGWSLGAWTKPPLKKAMFPLKFFKVLDENVSKAIGFWRFF